MVVVIGHCHVLWVPPNVHNPDQRAMNELLKSESRVKAVNEKLKLTSSQNKEATLDQTRESSQANKI